MGALAHNLHVVAPGNWIPSFWVQAKGVLTFSETSRIFHYHTFGSSHLCGK